MLAVGKDLLLPLLVEVEKCLGIEDTCIAVILAGLIQQESLLARHGIETVNPLLYHRRAAHEAVAAERVRQRGDIPRRRQPPQRLQQPLVTVYLCVKPAYYLVIRHPAGIEKLIFAGYFLQRVGHVEGIVFVLGIQHEREFVVLLDHVDHLLVLFLVKGLHIRSCRAQPVILLLELVTEHRQGIAKVPLVEYGHGRDAKKHKDCDNETLSFHTGMTFVVLYFDNIVKNPFGLVLRDCYFRRNFVLIVKNREKIRTSVQPRAAPACRMHGHPPMQPGG